MPVLQTLGNCIRLALLLLEADAFWLVLLCALALDPGPGTASIIERCNQILKSGTVGEKGQLLVLQRCRKICLYCLIYRLHSVLADRKIGNIAVEVDVKGIVVLEGIGVVNLDRNLNSIGKSAKVCPHLLASWIELLQIGDLYTWLVFKKRFRITLGKQSGRNQNQRCGNHGGCP